MVVQVPVAFAHDSTVAALLGATGLADGRDALGLVPFASRLIFERTACGEVALRYNDVVVEVFADLAAWRRRRRSAARGFASRRPAA